MQKKKKGRWKTWIAVVTTLSATITACALNVGKICTFVGNQFFDKNPPNYKVAFQFYKIAAGADNAEAEYRLGHMYENGIGTEVDERESLKYYGRANNHGLYELSILPTPIPEGMTVAQAEPGEETGGPGQEESEVLSEVLTEGESEPLTEEILETGEGGSEEAEEGLVEEAEFIPLVIEPVLRKGAEQKALTWLQEQAAKAVPLSSYEPEAEALQEAERLYDNALAALALLSDESRQAGKSKTAAADILDELGKEVREGSVLSEEVSTRSLAALAFALLKADQKTSTVSYVRAAQKVLDWLEEERGQETGYLAGASLEGCRTVDHLYLAAAGELLEEKTGNEAYRKMAERAVDYVRFMRSSDGTFFLAGTDTGEILSVEVQALLVLVMKDRSGLLAAQALLREDGGFPADESHKGLCVESTLLMSLAYQSMGIEDRAESAFAAAYGYQLADGAVPECSEDSQTDALGRQYRNLPRTSTAAWFVLAAGEKGLMD